MLFLSVLLLCATFLFGVFLSGRSLSSLSYNFNHIPRRSLDFVRLISGMEAAEKVLLLLQTHYTEDWEKAVGALSDVEMFNQGLRYTKGEKSVNHWLQSRKAKALQAYWTGDGVVVHQHITHNAGTFMCSMTKQRRISQGLFACNPMNVKELKRKIRKSGLTESDLIINNGTDERYRSEWISLEFPWSPNMPWDSERLTFVTVFRDPITRALASDGSWIRVFPKVAKAIQDETFDSMTWTGYEHSSYSDNYNIRHLLGKTPSLALTRRDLEEAKAILSRFTFVLILEWMEASFKMYCEALSWDNCILPPHHKRREIRPGFSSDTGARGCIMNDTIYANIVDRNAFDIELYHYAIDLNLQQMQRYNQDLSFLKEIRPLFVLETTIGSYADFS